MCSSVRFTAATRELDAHAHGHEPIAATWALVLAAGDGTRLRTLTTDAGGTAIPKQFCSLRGGPSLLQSALRRGASIATRDRICAVLAAQHERWWRTEVGRAAVRKHH